MPDFAAGAMENWGLITYRMRALLVNDETASPFDKQWVVIVIAHELAHQVRTILYCVARISNHCLCRIIFLRNQNVTRSSVLFDEFMLR